MDRELYKASFGVGASNVPEEELDAYVAALLTKEWREKKRRYDEIGIRAYVTGDEAVSSSSGRGAASSRADVASRAMSRHRQTPPPGTTRTNKRFLSNIVKNTDQHNRHLREKEVQRSRQLLRSLDGGHRAHDRDRTRPQRHSKRRRRRSEEDTEDESDVRSSRHRTRHRPARTRQRRRSEEDTEDELDVRSSRDRTRHRPARTRQRRRPEEDTEDESDVRSSPDRLIDPDLTSDGRVSRNDTKNDQKMASSSDQCDGDDSESAYGPKPRIYRGRGLHGGSKLDEYFSQTYNPSEDRRYEQDGSRSIVCFPSKADVPCHSSVRITASDSEGASSSTSTSSDRQRRARRAEKKAMKKERRKKQKKEAKRQRRQERRKGKQKDIETFTNLSSHNTSDDNDNDTKAFLKNLYHEQPSLCPW